MSGEAPLLVVTTRSRLRTPARFGHMWLATLRIRRQLIRDPDVVRWASVIAGPREFWTITVWRSRHPMLEFMRSGAHDDIMWLFSKWLDSFWLMRWRPRMVESGDWDGVALAPEGAGDDGPTTDAQDPRRQLLDEALTFLPRLRSATGPDGAATFDATPAARRRREEVGGSRSVVIRVRSSWWQTASALRDLRQLRSPARSDAPDRATVGVGRTGETYLLAVWRDGESAERFAGGSHVAALRQRWGDGVWTNVWTPENEFGSWDGLRLRRGRDRYAIQVPAKARALDDQN
ncbi:MAG: hypothetical protein OSA99_16815 [Acidimicrobiales bacterium]|nr:hypothetical protein [Acidimicrobiales bacterium]